ncbi:hypothetical protein FNF29_04640 [Cafeteria roenbergensis]|uniref:Uncharacterized protein n=1 Tax=Cafeteria roenbergensis TaxID=33653 RepID=A0A5A8CEM9_CAFRO|nr:hypothetical protein FNF29_04640 [Cafeteria roenbergensis]|eukprot:KAA0151432.1 hypothetical protein FNF29_04640 [Cafeteria roenbergensis]
MKILLVGIPPRKGRLDERRLCDGFQALLRDAGIEAGITALGCSALGPFLYQKDTPFTDPASIVRFDAVDIVLLVGDPASALLPWETGMEQFLDDRTGDLLHLSERHGAWHPVASLCMRRWDKYKSVEPGEDVRTGAAAMRVAGDASARLAPPPAGGENSLRVSQAAVTPAAACDPVATAAGARAFAVQSACRWRIDDRALSHRAPSFTPLIAHRAVGDRAQGVLVFRIGNALGSIPDALHPGNAPLRRVFVAHLRSLAAAAGRRGRLGESAAALSHLQPEALAGSLPHINEAPQSAPVFFAGRAKAPFERLGDVAASVRRATAAESAALEQLDDANDKTRRSGATAHVFDSTASAHLGEQAAERLVSESVSVLRPASPSGGLRFWDTIAASAADTGRDLSEAFLHTVRLGREEAAELDLIMSGVGAYQDKLTLERREAAESRARWISPKAFVTSVEGESKRRPHKLLLESGGIVDDHQPYKDPDPRRRFREETKERFLSRNGFVVVGDPSTFGATSGTKRTVKLGEKRYTGVQTA